MIVPEIILYHSLCSLIAYIKKDYESDLSVTKTDNILYKLLAYDDNGISLKMYNFDYYQQAVSLFVSNQQVNVARKLEVSVGYNTKRMSLPTIHIMLPSEQDSDNGIGEGEGYVRDEIIEDKDGNVIKKVSSYTCVFDSSYSLLLTSDNNNEVVLMYHVLKNLLFGCFKALEFRGLRNVKFGGQDLQMNTEFVPPEIYHRSLNLKFFYESVVKDFIPDDVASGLTFNGTDEAITKQTVI